MDKVLLIDTHNAIHRANITFGKFEHEICKECVNEKHIVDLHCKCGSAYSEDGFCYGNKYLIVYNFFRNLRPLIERFSPDICFFVLEGRPQFRYDLYPDYKANRIIKYASKPETAEKISFAQNEIVRLLQYLPVSICRDAGAEADDVINTLAHNMKDEDITIISNDNDYIQLLQQGFSNLKIFNPIKKEFMEAPAFLYVAWKILAGDKSDNIPGLLKPKLVMELINNPEKLKQFLSIEENRANFNINKQLIEFKIVEDNNIIIQKGVKNFDILKREFEQMKFFSIINEDSWKKFTSTFDCLKF